MYFQVASDPHPWPRNGETPTAACAVIVIDMQNDFCAPGFYMDQAGYDPRRLSRPIPRIRRVLAAARAAGMPVVYTRHGRAPDTAPPQAGAAASAFPQTAETGTAGWQIVPALKPQMGEAVFEKNTCSAFFSGELEHWLRSRGIGHLAFCGNTIDVCVHSSLRAAVDLGYRCLLLADCCGAVNAGLQRWAIESVTVEDGVFGSVTNAQAFVQALA